MHRATPYPAPEARFQQVYACIQRGDLKSTWQHLATLERDYPEHPLVHQFKAGLLSQSGQHNLALTCYLKALALTPGDSLAQMGVAGCLMAMGQLPDALQHLRAALQSQCEHPKLSIPKPGKHRFDPRRAEQTLWQVLAQLAAAGVHAFPTSGTLLGLVREGQLLAFDKDLDVGLPYSEMGTAAACMQQHGWQRKHNLAGLVNPQEWHHADNGIALDLCGFAPEPTSGLTISGFWYQTPQHPWSRITEFAELKLHSTRRTEGSVWQLRNPLDILLPLYGPDWRTPDPTFDTVVGAHNLRGFRLLTQCYGLTRIARAWTSGRLYKARSLVRHCLRHAPDDLLLQQIAVALQSPPGPPSAEAVFSALPE